MCFLSIIRFFISILYNNNFIFVNVLLLNNNSYIILKQKAHLYNRAGYTSNNNFSSHTFATSLAMKVVSYSLLCIKYVPSKLFISC